MSTFGPKGLVAFDVDGTLLRGRTVCECIAENIGRKAEMQAFERLSSIEEITSARQQMVTWYSDHEPAAILGHVKTATLAPGAQEGLRLLKEAGFQIALVSLTWQFAVDWLAEELGADFILGTRWLSDGGIEHVWPDDKAKFVMETAALLGVPMGFVTAVGDSSGDLPMLAAAGAGYFVWPAAPELPPHVRHWPSADITLVAKGILAAVRPRT